MNNMLVIDISAALYVWRTWIALSVRVEATKALKKCACVRMHSKAMTMGSGTKWDTPSEIFRSLRGSVFILNTKMRMASMY
jgi:hypothetical protein